MPVDTTFNQDSSSYRRNALTNGLAKLMAGLAILAVGAVVTWLTYTGIFGNQRFISTGLLVNRWVNGYGYGYG